MRVGVFTPLLSQLPLDQVLKKLAGLHINTVELETGNYVGGFSENPNRWMLRDWGGPR